VSIQAYFNYPNSSITIHREPGCPRIRMTHKPGQRQFDVTKETVSSVVAQFTGCDVTFASTPGRNDLWLKVKLNGEDEDVRFVDAIKALLGKRYSRFRDVQVVTHCG
jgi:hypothetical protein